MVKLYSLPRNFHISRLAAIALLLGLSGCEVAYPTQEGELFSAPAAPPADFGLLYVYRLFPDKSSGLARRVRIGQGISGPVPVMVQEEAVGGVLFNGYLMLPLAPGEHAITVDKVGLPAAPGKVECGDLGEEGPLVVKIEAGANTYVQLHSIWETRSRTVAHSGQVGPGAGGGGGMNVSIMLKRIGIAVCFTEVEEAAALASLAVTRHAGGAH